jgi:hypothetical protein
MMKRSRLFSLCLAMSLCPTAALAQSSPVRLETAAAKPANLDFEEGEPGKVPTGWLVTTASDGFQAEVTTESRQVRRFCQSAITPI